MRAKRKTPLTHVRLGRRDVEEGSSFVRSSQHDFLLWSIEWVVDFARGSSSRAQIISQRSDHFCPSTQNRPMGTVLWVVMFWWARRDSNSHALRHQLLRLACIPISPLAHFVVEVSNVVMEPHRPSCAARANAKKYVSMSDKEL